MSEYTPINPTCKPHVMSEHIFIQILCSSMPCRYVCDFMCVCVCIYVLPRYPSKWWATSGYKQKNCQPASWNRKNMGKFKVPLGNPEVAGFTFMGTEPSKLWKLTNTGFHGSMDWCLEKQTWKIIGHHMVTTSHFPIFSNFREQRFKQNTSNSTFRNQPYLDAKHEEKGICV